MKVSKSFQTDSKDSIRVVFATGRTAILMSDKKSDFPDVTVDVPEGIEGPVAKKGFCGKLWDAIKSFVKGVIGGVDIGGGIKCKPGVEVIRDPSGRIIEYVAKIVCTF